MMKIKYFDAYYQKDMDPAITCGLRMVTLKDALDTGKYAFVLRSATHDGVGALDRIYAYMQGETWSANGEARDLIKALGLRHTSMSIGDVIHDVISGKRYQVAQMGFEELK